MDLFRHFSNQIESLLNQSGCAGFNGNFTNIFADKKLKIVGFQLEEPLLFSLILQMESAASMAHGLLSIVRIRVSVWFGRE